MSLLAPAALWLLALTVPLILLYFIRVRRREQKVSSLLLWRAAPKFQGSSSFFQRMQRDPLLLLQLLCLLLLALALARPSVTVMGESERKVVVVLDTSASMKARDVSPSRFDAAKARAHALVDELVAGTKVMVIEAGIQPRVTAPMSGDRSRALDAIDNANARDLPNKIEDALRTARALIGDDKHAEIHIFTDGAFAEPPKETDTRVHWIGVGRSDNNAGITHLAVRKTYQGAGGYEALLSVANYSAQARTVAFSVKVEDRTIAERELKLGPHLHRTLILPFRNNGAARVTARLRVTDDLDADNVAYAIVPPPNKMLVTLVSEGNLFLEKVLRADPEIALDVKRPSQYPGGMGNADVVILDSVTPAKVGAGRFIFVNTVPPDVPIDILGTMEKPQVSDWDRSHPIMRHVDFSKIAIESAMRIRPLTPGRPLVEAALGGPLVYSIEEAHRKAILIGFDLFKADLPLRVAFPLLIGNGIRWLHQGGIDQQMGQIAAGQPLLAPVPVGVESVTITTPSGKTVSQKVANGAVSFTDTDEVGIYSLQAGKAEMLVAANLMDSEESDIAPRPLPAGSTASLSNLAPVDEEYWKVLVVLALLVLAVEGLLYVRRQSGGRIIWPSDPNDRLVLSVRTATMAMLCVVFFGPSFPQWVDRMNVIFLLDHSDSINASAKSRTLQFVQQAVREANPEDQHGIVVFGANAAVERPVGAHTEVEAPQKNINGRGTNIFQALQLGLAMLPAEQSNRIVLLSDGRQTSGNALDGAQAARSAGTEIHYITAPLTLAQEVVAESLLVPREVKFGEPFFAKLVAWSYKETPARVSLFRNGQFVGSQQVRLTAGKNVFSYRQSLDRDGIHVYQAAIDVDGDTIEENNRAVGTVLVRGRPQILIADRDRNHAQSLASALRAQQLEVTLVDPSRIPNDIASLKKYDGIILSNVSAINLNRNQMVNIRDYVRDHGGGLIMVGGDQSFGLGGYYQTPIEEALPVTMEVKQRVDVPNLSIVLSIDRSDSMTTIATGKVTYLDLAKEAAHLVIDLIDENSEVGIMSWDHEWKWEMTLRQAKNKDQLHNAIASIVSGGGTEGFPALREAHAALMGRPALLKHVIFLTDGQMRRDQFQDLVERMARDQITVSSVAVGKYSDERLLLNISQWGKGRFYRTEDSQSLPRIFAVETQLASNSTVVEQPFKPILTDPSHETAQEIDWKNVPQLNGYVATTAKAGAEQVLLSHWEDPILATWRYGLGRAAAFTSDTNPRWAQQWLNWRDFNKFWSQLARWTLRSGSNENFSASVGRRDGFGEVTIEAIDSKGAFINLLDTQVGVVSPNRDRTVIDLEQIAPGRYRGRFPATQEGVYLVGMAQRLDNSELGSQLSGLVVPYAEELRELGVNETALKELTGLTGGAAIENPKEVFQKDRKPYRISVQIWPWIVILAAIFMLLE
ncbi:MAG: VWA domain-containing protein, partial [Burkholderiales bacterium]